jgi:hypothetical protein
VGLIDQLIGSHFTLRTHFLYQIDAQNWPSVMLNSLVKVSKNEVIAFERLKISLISFVGPVGLG